MVASFISTGESFVKTLAQLARLGAATCLHLGGGQQGSLVVLGPTDEYDATKWKDVALKHNEIACCVIF